MADIFAQGKADDPYKDKTYEECVEVVKKTVNLHHNGRIRIFELEFDFIENELVQVNVVGA